MLELQCPYEKVRWSRVTFQNNSSDTRHQRLLVTNINPANLWCQPSITNKIINSKRYLSGFLRFTLFPKMYVYICKIAQIFIYIIYDPVIVDVNAVYVLVMHVHAYK